jgi:4-hydroxybenzoate polyprenyltransferase
VLGLALGFSAAGGWIAVTGSIATSAVLLGVAVTLWVAGFDIIYACQDVAFDHEQGLHSMPSALGIRRALLLSKILHGLTIGLMVLLSLKHPLWSGLWLGTLLMGGFLVWEHQLVSPDNLDQVDAAFFTANGKISVGVFTSVLLGHGLVWLGFIQ